MYEVYVHAPWGPSSTQTSQYVHPYINKLTYMRAVSIKIYISKPTACLSGYLPVHTHLY
jgi:hypothetical protein